MARKHNFYDRLQARLITPYIDNFLWKIVSRNPNIIEEKFETNLENLYWFYPDLDIKKITKGGYSFMLDNFSSYRFKAENVWLDPDFGWIIPSSLKIFKYSFPYSVDPWDRIKRRPSTFKFFRKTVNTRYVDRAASIRFGWQNYYHFLIDGLTQLRALDKFDPEGTIPIIVPESYDKQSFTRSFFEQVYGKKRRLIVQSKMEYIYAKELYLVKEDILSNSLDEVVDLLRPNSTLSESKRLFIIRNNQEGRSIRNMGEILPILNEFGFQLVDCNRLTLKEQVELFSSASFVIGIHGAGLTNTLFKKGGNLKVLEIAPDLDFQPEHYKNICIKYGFEHNLIFGEDLDRNSNFILNPDCLRDFLNKFEK